MNTQNFQNLIQAITGRELIINTSDIEIQTEKEYYIYKIFPLTQRKSGFNWKTAKTEEKMLRSFITAFCNKYIEPNPKTYDYEYGGKTYKWEDRTPIEKEYALSHHRTHQFNKTDLMSQISENFNKEGIQNALIKYGFYNTEYGIGIFCFWETDCVKQAINKMAKYLNDLSIPFKNEYSDARWVFRFKLNLTKDQHNSILNQFTATN